jgi:hypothetical protein
MNVRLDVIVSAIARDSGLDPDRNPTDKLNIIGWVNDTRREIYDLPTSLQALNFTGELVGVGMVTAGTVSATQGNAEVTGAGTAWTAAMVGRYLSVNSSPWQKVSFVTDTTHLTLESGWNAATQATVPYKIWKRVYDLPPKAAKVERIFDYSRPTNAGFAYYDPQEFYSRYGLGDSFGEPEAYTQFQSSDFGDAYLASTVYTSVSSTANSPIVDFTGATLIGTVFPGDRLKIGDSTTSTAFSVERVLTNNKIALKNYISISSSALSATALSMDRLQVMFYPAIDNTKVYAFEGVRQVYDLSNNGDFLEKGWYNAVLKGSVAKAFGYVRDPREGNKQGEYGVETAKLIRNQMKAFNPSPRLKPYIGRRYGNSGLPAEDRDMGY